MPKKIYVHTKKNEITDPEIPKDLNKIKCRQKTCITNENQVYI